MTSVTRGYPAGNLRVSDADRDQAVAELSEHFQAGRLTADEFEERSGQALQARTGADLANLLTDLPAPAVPQGVPGPFPGPSPFPGRPSPDQVQGPRPLLARTPVVPIAVAAVAAVVAVAIVLSSISGPGHHHRVMALWPLFVVLLVVRRLARGRGGWR